MYITSTNSAKTMAQEATETPAQTKAEAAKGDQQAVRKLAQGAQSSPLEAPKAVNDPSRGLLDVKA